MAKFYQLVILDLNLGRLVALSKRVVWTQCKEVRVEGLLNVFECVYIPPWQYNFPRDGYISQYHKIVHLCIPEVLEFAHLGSD